VVLLRRHGGSRLRQPVHSSEPARYSVVRSASLADTGIDRQVLRTRGLAWLQPDIFAPQLSRSDSSSGSSKRRRAKGRICALARWPRSQTSSFSRRACGSW
jgi:hypothetical protein